MNKKFLIAISTYKEEENIIELIKKIRNEVNDITILIINDNSNDNTKNLIKELNDKNVIYLERPRKLGLGTAHKLSIFFAIKNNYDFLITMDADFSHDPIELKNFTKYLENYPFVIGSRYIEGGKCLMKGSRLIMSKVGNLVIKFFSGINCNEFTTSYRGFNIKKLINFHLKDVNEGGYSFFMGTLFEINKKKFVIKEIPIVFFDREKGVSKIPRLEIFRTLKNLMFYVFKK